MWNRQREAEEAREKLARAGEQAVAPNRNPPEVIEESTVPAGLAIDVPADAAE